MSEPSAVSLSRRQKHHLSTENLSHSVPDLNASIKNRIKHSLSKTVTFCRSNTSGEKYILKDVNFEIESGEMLAILGSSGSGKSTLLDVLACRMWAGISSGKVFLDGCERTEDLIKKQSAYVRQDDRLTPHLTVKETLMFVAQLILPADWTTKQRQEKVDSVLNELGLRHVSEVKVGGGSVHGISGGERRRVTIASQLLLNPNILFLDEPTSGLDSFTANHLIRTLDRLAKNNRIVIVTIHQPRSDIFKLFDKVMMLSQGEQVYFGRASQMIDYFSRAGHTCPSLVNPCDYFIDIASVDVQTEETEFESRERVAQLVDFYKRNASELNQNIKNEEKQRNPAEPLGVNGCFTAYPSSTDNSQIVKDSDWMSSEIVKRNDKTMFFIKYSVLLIRMLRNTLEDYSYLSAQSCQALLLSIVVGLVYFNLQLVQATVIDRFALIYVISALYPYMVILDTVGQYHEQRSVLFNELQDGLYSTLPFVLAKVTSEIPLHIITVALNMFPVYFLANLRFEVNAVFSFFGIYLNHTFSSRLLALWSAATMPTYQSAVIFAQSFYTMSLLSCGFIFNLNNIFVVMKWTSYVSYLKYGYQALCVTDMRGVNITCESPLPAELCYRDGDEALRSYALHDLDRWQAVLAINAINLFYFLAFLLTARFVSQKPEEK